MRQWPAGHFATLIDLLVAKNGVHVVVLGSPDEAALCEEVLSHVTHRNGVVSLAGKTTRDQLPILLGACALFVGNNSGPKHIAAAGLAFPPSASIPAWWMPRSGGRSGHARWHCSGT